MRRALLITLLTAAALLWALPGSRPQPAGAATASPTKTPTPTPTPTPPPPSSLPARFSGKLTFATGFKAPSKAALAVYSDADTKCVEGTVSSGAYAVNVPRGVDRPGCPSPGSAVYFKLGDYWAVQSGNWVAGMPTALDLTFPKMDSVALGPGCTQATTTFSNGTAVKSIIDNLNPADTLVALWRWNGQDWEGYFPGAPAGLNSMKTVNRLDVLWVCTPSGTTLTRPAVAPSLITGPLGFGDAAPN